MEAVLLIAIQGPGKSTFYCRRFFHTHVRLSLDLPRTRRLRAGVDDEPPLYLYLREAPRAEGEEQRGHGGEHGEV